MRPAVLLLALLVTACAGDEVDAVDPVCTKSLYDVCSTEHDCDNEICKGFADLPTPVCSAPCETPADCPDQAGAAATCVENLCRPPAATACARPLTDAGVP